MLWFGCLNVRLVKELVATFVAWFAVVNAIALVTLLAMTCRSTMDSFGIATLLPLLSLTAFMDASPASTRVKSATLQVLHILVSLLFAAHPRTHTPRLLRSSAVSILLE